jgi:hypothetical protein
MRFHLSGPRRPWPVLSLAALLWAAIITGCESSRPSLDDPEVKKQVQARQEIVNKEEDQANAILKKRKGKNAPVMKSFKGGGGIKVGQPESQ